LSWSVSYRDIQPTSNYSVREIRDSTGENRWNASLTWEPIDGLFLRTNIDGPRTQIRESLFYGQVRAIGLDPSFIATTRTRQDQSVSFAVEWRRDRFEITGSISTRPENTTIEVLTPFGEPIGSLLTTAIDETPQAMLRFRIIS
jgi:hypothetical protein